MKVIIEADPDNLILAVRAARTFEEKHPETNVMAIRYANDVTFFLMRNKRSIRAVQERK